MYRRLLHVCAAFVALAACTDKQKNDEHAVETSLADLKVHDGFNVSLFASEPMFSNPTNIAIDARGRVWVCEAYNYRMQFNAKNPTRQEGDRIMILEDTDGDGAADVSKVFYQGTDINSALGICILGNKVIVSRSPDVFVFTDTNGDDIPDKKEVLFTGIQGEQHDHGMHAFIFGHDGRLYFNMGNEGKSLLTASKDTVVDIHGRKVVTDGKPFREGLAMRADIDGSHVEVLGSNFRNPFELTLDPFGTIWQSDNDDDGNKGTRINYVMEQGNYGYTDEVTGASWSTRRTNMEKEIPLRHWHLSDPGAVPNVLQTGSGSPSGITVYEGDMLTGFYGQLIHAEPGHNVVRSYPMQEDGAGYKATIENILEGQKDQWFRPVDVAIAPDGSLFVADWYDPGVGGHQVGDLDRGRIYRVTKKSTPRLGYLPLPADLTTPEGCTQALTNPNNDIRYQAWTALAAQGEKAAPALEKLWASENVRHRAQALWLLARLPKADTYIQQAAKDDNANLRIQALRVAREQKKDIFALAVSLADDASAQVRREVALSIRGSQAPKAPDLWTKLALQYDGKDRWYLEALGIGAQGNEEKFFAAWKNAIGREWSTPAGSDIVWRSRSQAALPLMTELIKKADDNTALRYYRAFDFHTSAQKQNILAQLVTQTQGKKVLYALKHMDAAQFKMTPPVKTALNKVLQEYRDKLEFVELVRSFNLQDKNADLLAMAIHYPDSTAGREAAKLLIERDKTVLFQKAFDERNKEQSIALVKALWSQMFRLKTIALMEGVMLDTTQDVELRKLTVKTFGGPWECEDRLLELAKTNKIPRDLQTAAAGVLQSAWRGQFREEAAKYIKLPPSKNGGVLPAISELTEKSGNAGKGKEVFNTLCSTCHQVDKAGVNFGPDLSEIGAKLSPEGLYKAILFPDQGISFGFEGYRIQLKDGSSVFGRIASETEDKIDIQYMANTQSIQKADIASRTQVPGSMMPANLQSMMTEEELVDLVSYLKDLKKVEVAAR